MDFSQKKYEPTPNMMRWMKYYNEKCSKACCYSPDCGCIRCSSCKISLTKIPPSLRYQCNQCPIVAPEAPYNPKPDLCYSCFMNPLVLHGHKEWLEITEKGVHSLISRENGYCEIKYLDISKDFEKCGFSNSDSCFICVENFTNDNPAVKFPGCLKDHGNGIKDLNLGIRDSKEHAHAFCLLKWYETSFRDTYCGKTKYCEVCNFEEELESWEREFKEIKLKISQRDLSDIYLQDSYDKLNIVYEPIKKELGAIKADIREKLIELHPQKWIQNIINSIFS